MFSFIKQTYQIKRDKTIEFQEKDIAWIQDPIFEDKFRVHVFSHGLIQITYGNQRSLAYSKNAIQELKEKGLYPGVYEGGPDFQIRGIIEGFYGTPWTHDTRMDVIDFIHTYHMNAYFYAPKDDQYHRELWREPYPEKELSLLEALIRNAQEKHVDFFFCISPGKDFDYTKNEDFKHLFLKLKQVMSFGVTHFCLLMDDIDYKLDEDAEKQFKTPGLAHAYISNQMNAYIKSELKSFKFVMCPTEYWQNWDTPYRKDLKEHLDQNIIVFWTGYNTIAEYIPDLDGQKAKEIFGHDLILWDNYPVNDMDTDRLFLGALRNRGKHLFQSHVGMISNPMIQWQLSKIPLITMALFMWDSYRYEENSALEYAIDELLKGQFELKGPMSVFVSDNTSSLIYEKEHMPLKKAINDQDIDQVIIYMKHMKESVDKLRNRFNNHAFLVEAEPWFQNIDQSYQCLLDIKHNKHCDLDIKSEKAHHGTHVVYEFLSAIDKYDGPKRKRERPNFWDQKDNK